MQPDTPHFGFAVARMALHFDLDPICTRVVNRLHLQRISDGSDIIELPGPIERLKSAQVRGTGELEVADGRAIARSGASEFHLEFVTELSPRTTRPRVGLFEVEGTICTQCEPRGFRVISFSQDEPNARTAITVEVSADLEKFPVLISNGNLIAEHRRRGRLTCVWEDPIPKPTYLFALVAGRFACSRRKVTSSFDGAVIDLALYARPERIRDGEFSLDVLEDAVSFDESLLGSGTHLPSYSMVAIEGYPQTGAEAQGIGLFEAGSLLVDHRKATEQKLQAIERSVAHEFFHTWTGVKIGITNWSQLSLKEALTVFREQLFIERRRPGDLLRLAYVRRLRRSVDDLASDMRALCAPTPRYVSATYYYGVSILEALRLYVGQDQFVSVLRLFAATYDGKSAEWLSFFRSARDVANCDPEAWRALTEAPPPTLNIEVSQHKAGLVVHMRRQHVAASRRDGDAGKPPLIVPFDLLYYDQDRQMIAERPELLVVDSGDIESSADVKCNGLIAWGIGRSDLMPYRVVCSSNSDGTWRLAMHSPGRFSRALYLKSHIIQLLSAAARSGMDEPFSEAQISTLEHMFRRVLQEEGDIGVRADCLSFPSVNDVLRSAAPCSAERASTTRLQLARRLAIALREEIREAFEEHSYGPSKRLPDAAMMTARCVELMAADPNPQYIAQLQSLLRTTDEASIVLMVVDACVSSDPGSALSFAEMALDRFEDESFQDRVAQILARHWPPSKIADLASGHVERFNPQYRARQFWRAFALGNPVEFHRTDGSGYELLCKYILINDRENPILAARLAKLFDAAAYVPWVTRVEAFRRIGAITRRDNISEHLASELRTLLHSMKDRN